MMTGSDEPPALTGMRTRSSRDSSGSDGLRRSSRSSRGSRGSSRAGSANGVVSPTSSIRPPRRPLSTSNDWEPERGRPMRPRIGGGASLGTAPSAAEFSPQRPSAICDDTRAIGSSRRMDQDRISDWTSASRVSQVPDSTITLGHLTGVHVQTRVRASTFTWSFRKMGKLIANITVEGGFHPIAQLHKFTVTDAYAEQGLTSPSWSYVEEALMGYGFEDIHYDSARYVTDEQLRGSMGEFYAGQGVDLDAVERVHTEGGNAAFDRWTVQDSGGKVQVSTCTPRQQTLSVQLSKLNQMSIAEGSAGCESSPASSQSSEQHSPWKLEAQWSGTPRRGSAARQLLRVSGTSSDERGGSSAASTSSQDSSGGLCLLRKAMSGDVAEMHRMGTADVSRATYPLAQVRKHPISSPMGTHTQLSIDEDSDEVDFLSSDSDQDQVHVAAPKRSSDGGTPRLDSPVIYSASRENSRDLVTSQDSPRVLSTSRENSQDTTFARLDPRSSDRRSSQEPATSPKRPCKFGENAEGDEELRTPKSRGLPRSSRSLEGLETVQVSTEPPHQTRARPMFHTQWADEVEAAAALM